MRRLLLVDGHSVIYRSFFAFIRQPLRNSRGMNTSAVFGFASTLRRVLDRLKPELVAVAFDAPGRTFRDEMFEQYKAQRPAAPEELSGQIPVVKEMVRAWGLASFEVPGVEADDVLGTLAVRGAAAGLEVVIATSDKDMLQLVGGRVTVYDPWLEKRLGPAEVKEKLGVEPAQVPDYLALTGDSTDNVPGVPGIGPKRALEVLQKHGSLARALEADERVRKHADAARLSRELVEIHTGVEVAAGVEGLAPAAPDRESLRRIYEEMGFRGLLRELAIDDAPKVDTVGFDGFDRVRAAGAFGFHVEPDGRLWVSLDGLAAMEVTEDPGRLLADAKLLKVGHGVKEAARTLGRAGISPPAFDVGVGAWMVDPNRKRYELEDVSLMVLGQSAVFQDPAAKAACCLRAFRALEPQLDAMGLRRAAEDIEMPLVFVLARMEERGVRVDPGFLAALEQELLAEQGSVEREVWRLAGAEFNIASPKQLGEVLFAKLGLPHGRKTKTGYSTASEVLEELAPGHPIAAQVLRYRELGKLCGTYLAPLREQADPETHRVHATFNQTGTSTGRLSASDPNLQNVPIRTELGRRIRQGFVAGPGRVLVSADYSQIELRVLAHVSGDERLAEAFERGEDVHVATAASILGIAADAVTPEQRRIAKMVNYGLVYGMGDYGLSWRMDMPVEEARAFLDGYMQRFAGVAGWRERLVEQARNDGWVRTLSGRIRPVPGIVDGNRAVAEAVKRAALNAPIQGSAADIIKKAMLGIEPKLPGAMILQVHDELLFEVEEAKARDAVELVKAEMEGAWRLSVPLAVEVGTGRSWGEAH